MYADQAAGLRRKPMQQRGAQIVTLMSDDASIAVRLAHAIQARGERVLLVDTTGRHLMAGQAHAIFGWQQQVARNHLQTMGVSGVDFLNAPGAQAGEAGIVQAATGYDTIIFDSVLNDSASTRSDTLSVDLSTAQTLIVQANGHTESVCNTYALIKGMAESNLVWPAFLFGDPARCERIEAAVQAFLRVDGEWPKSVRLEEDAHFVALAARITAGETDASRLYNNTGAMQTQHG